MANKCDFNKKIFKTELAIQSRFLPKKLNEYVNNERIFTPLSKRVGQEKYAPFDIAVKLYPEKNEVHHWIVAALLLHPDFLNSIVTGENISEYELKKTMDKFIDIHKNEINSIEIISNQNYINDKSKVFKNLNLPIEVDINKSKFLEITKDKNIAKLLIVLNGFSDLTQDGLFGGRDYLLDIMIKNYIKAGVDEDKAMNLAYQNKVIALLDFVLKSKLDLNNLDVEMFIDSIDESNIDIEDYFLILRGFGTHIPVLINNTYKYFRLSSKNSFLNQKSIDIIKPEFEKVLSGNENIVIKKLDEDRYFLYKKNTPYVFYILNNKSGIAYSYNTLSYVNENSFLQSLLRNHNFEQIKLEISDDIKYIKKSLDLQNNKINIGDLYNKIKKTSKIINNIPFGNSLFDEYDNNRITKFYTPNMSSSQFLTNSISLLRISSQFESKSLQHELGHLIHKLYRKVFPEQLSIFEQNIFDVFVNDKNLKKDIEDNLKRRFYNNNKLISEIFPEIFQQAVDVANGTLDISDAPLLELLVFDEFIDEIEPKKWIDKLLNSFDNILTIHPTGNLINSTHNTELNINIPKNITNTIYRIKSDLSNIHQEGSDISTRIVIIDDYFVNKNLLKYVSNKADQIPQAYILDDFIYVGELDVIKKWNELNFIDLLNTLEKKYNTKVEVRFKKGFYEEIGQTEVFYKRNTDEIGKYKVIFSTFVSQSDYLNLTEREKTPEEILNKIHKNIKLSKPSLETVLAIAQNQIVEQEKNSCK